MNPGTGKRKRNPGTKLAVNPSKRHRDRLNAELKNIAQLLPYTTETTTKLDKLSILRLAVCYVRNKRYFQVLDENGNTGAAGSCPASPQVDVPLVFTELVNQALNGFILVLLSDGEVFYVTDNVFEFLGIEQVNIMHQNLGAFIESKDSSLLNSFLSSIFPPKSEDGNSSASSDTEHKQVVLRLKTTFSSSIADLYRPFRLRGRLRQLPFSSEQPNLRYGLFMFCAPVTVAQKLQDIQLQSLLFCSKMRFDMTIVDLDEVGRKLLGYSKKDVSGRTCLSLINKDDNNHFRVRNLEVILKGYCSPLVYRALSRSGLHIWTTGYWKLILKNGKPDFIVSTCRVLSDDEARDMIRCRDTMDRRIISEMGINTNLEPAFSLEERVHPVLLPLFATTLNDLRESVQSQFSSLHPEQSLLQSFSSFDRTVGDLSSIDIQDIVGSIEQESLSYLEDPPAPAPPEGYVVAPLLKGSVASLVPACNDKSIIVTSSYLQQPVSSMLFPENFTAWPNDLFGSESRDVHPMMYSISDSNGMGLFADSERGWSNLAVADSSNVFTGSLGTMGVDLTPGLLSSSSSDFVQAFHAPGLQAATGSHGLTQKQAAQMMRAKSEFFPAEYQTSSQMDYQLLQSVSASTPGFLHLSADSAGLGLDPQCFNGSTPPLAFSSRFADTFSTNNF